LALLGTTLKATYLIRQAVRRLKKGCQNGNLLRGGTDHAATTATLHRRIGRKCSALTPMYEKAHGDPMGLPY
jgi:hypothetical protein